jgi:hypothetical protein
VSSLYHKRLPDWEPFDEISMRIIPRYKTSGLSGDEWRQHVEIEFKHKGEVVFVTGARDMEAASMMLGHHLQTQTCPIPERVIAIDRDKCDQPSCTENAVGRYLIKQEFARDGMKLDSSDIYGAKYRQFCKKHARRGDCGREDSDRNYDPLDTLKPDASTNTEESPSVFGGVVELAAEDVKGPFEA